MKEKNYSNDIANAIKYYLKENGWHFSFDEDKGLFKFGLSIRSKIRNISYIIGVRNDAYIVYAISPVCADEDDNKMMAAMAEFVCRANYGLSHGNFELDMRDGEVRFKCFIDCKGIIPTKDMIKNSIYCPEIMFKRYGPGIVDIIFGNVTAKEAVEKCEKSAEEFTNLLKAILLQEETSDLDDTTIVSRLIELAKEDSELEDILSGLIEISDGSEPSDEDKPSNCSRVPELLKTDLFDTEGDNE